MTVTADVAVVGGGVIGTAIAWRSAAAGLDAVLVDPQRDDGASLVAAGMLAPVSESIFGEEALLRLNLLAVRRFPTFAADLEEAHRPAHRAAPGRHAGGGLRPRRPRGPAAADRVPPVGRPGRGRAGQPGHPQAGAVPHPGGTRWRAVRRRLVGGQPALPGRAAPGGAGRRGAHRARPGEQDHQHRRRAGRRRRHQLRDRRGRGGLGLGRHRRAARPPGRRGPPGQGPAAPAAAARGDAAGAQPNGARHGPGHRRLPGAAGRRRAGRSGPPRKNAARTGR